VARCRAEEAMQQRTCTLCTPKRKLLVVQRLRGLDAKLATLSSCGCSSSRWRDAWQWPPRG
jgi:hypothetical protein